MSRTKSEALRAPFRLRYGGLPSCDGATPAAVRRPLAATRSPRSDEPWRHRECDEPAASQVFPSVRGPHPTTSFWECPLSITARLAADGRVGFMSRSGPWAKVRFGSKAERRELPGPVRSAPNADITAHSISACARRAGTRTFFAFHSPAFHFASGQISGTSLPLCVQGSTVQSSLVLRFWITAVLCGPSVNRDRDTGAAIVWCRSNLSWSRTSSSEFVLLVVSMQSN